MILTREDFIEIIQALRDQFDFDKKKSKTLSELYGAEIYFNDNSRLINQLFKILHKNFPPGSEMCQIQMYCWEMDFGRNSEEKQTPGELYDELVENLDLIDSHVFGHPFGEEQKGCPFDEEVFNPEIGSEGETQTQYARRKKIKEIDEGIWITPDGEKHFRMCQAVKHQAQTEDRDLKINALRAQILHHKDYNHFDKVRKLQQELDKLIENKNK